jgi:hypothetical protein
VTGVDGGSWGSPVGLDRAAALQVGKGEDVAELGGRSRTESVKALVGPALELIVSSTGD